MFFEILMANLTLDQLAYIWKEIFYEVDVCIKWISYVIIAHLYKVPPNYEFNNMNKGKTRAFNNE